MKLKKIYLLLCTMLCGVVAAATAFGPSALRSMASPQTRAGEEYAVVIEGQDEGYNNLNDAVAAAESGATILLNGEIEISSRVNVNDKEVTIKSADSTSPATIYRKSGYTGILILSENKNGTAVINLENVLINGNNISCNNPALQAAGSGTFNMKDVILQNCISTNDQGLICAKGNGKLNAENLTIENCEVYEGKGEIFAGSSSISISGKCEISSIYIQSDNRINIGESDLTNTTPIKLYVDDSRTKDLIVKGYTHHKTSAEGDTNYIDPTKFILVKEDCSLAEDSTNEDEIHVAPIEDIKNMRVYLITSVEGDEYLYGFPKFHAAHSSTINDDIIVLNDDIEITHRVSPAGKGVTIKSADPSDPKTIICNKDRIFFLANAETGNLTFQDVIFDGQGETVWGTTVFEVNNGQLTLENVTIQNYKTKNTQGLISLKSSGNGKITANNLVIGAECTAEAEIDGNVVTYPQIFVGNNRHLELSGNCSFSINVEKNGQIDVEGEMTNTKAIPVIVDESRKNTIIINKCGDPTKFSVNCIEDFALAPTADGQNLELATTVVVNPEDSPVVNRTIPRGYDDLTTAFNAANAGDEIVVKEEQTTNVRLAGKNVSVKGENSEDSSSPVIIKGTEDNIFFIANSSDGPLTLENVVLDGSAKSLWTKKMLEADNADLKLKDVIIRNYKTSNNSIIDYKNNNAKVTVENLVIESDNCSSSEADIVVVNESGFTMKGNCQFTVSLSGSNSLVNVEGNLTNTTPIRLIVNDTRKGTFVVSGCTDATKFSISNEGLILEAVDGNLKLVSEEKEDPKTQPVYNTKTKEGFTTLAAAITAANSNDILLLNENQTIDARIALGSKALTIKGNGKTISRGENLKEILLLVNEAEGVLNLENVTIDGISKEVGKVAIEASNNGVVNLTDVTFANCKISEGNLISIKGGGHMTAENVKTVSCTVTDGNGEIFVGNNCTIDMTGDNNFSVILEGNGHINANNVTNTTPVKIYLTYEPTENSLVVKGCKNTDLFTIEVEKPEGCKLIAQGDDLMVEIPVIENPDDPGKEDPENPDDPNKENPENPDDPNKEDPEDNTKPVYNETSKKGYDTLELAFNAAENGDEIIVKENQTISTRLGGKNVTIKGENAENPVSITSEKDIIFFLAGTTDGPLTLENLVIDGGNTEWTSTAFEANGGELALKNVSIRNYKTTNGQGVISVKSSSNSKLTAENLVIESSCIVPSDVAQIFLGDGKHLEISGNCSFSVNIEGNGVIDVTGTLSNTTAIPVTINPKRTNTVIVTDCDDLTKFSILNEDCELVANEGNIEIFVPEIEDPNEEDDPIDPSSVSVYNETTGKGYDTLSEAFSAAKTGAVLILNEDQTVAERLSTDAREITIISEDNVTISRDKSYNGMLFLVNTNGGILTMENVTIDGSGVESNKVVIEASGNGVVNLTDVTMTNCVTTADQGIICIKSGGHVSADNLYIESSTVAPGNGEIYIGTNSSLTISGACKFTMKHQGNGSIDATDATHSSPLSLMLDGEYEDETVVVKGCPDLTKFNLNATGYVLTTKEGNLVVKKSVNTGIGQVDFDAEEDGVEYYTLQGQRVNNPSSGFYVRRQGNEVMKVYVK